MASAQCFTHCVMEFHAFLLGRDLSYLRSVCRMMREVRIDSCDLCGKLHTANRCVGCGLSICGCCQNGGFILGKNCMCYIKRRDSIPLESRRKARRRLGLKSCSCCGKSDGKALTCGECDFTFCGYCQSNGFTLGVHCLCYIKWEHPNFSIETSSM